MNPLMYFRGRARQAGIAALIVVIAGSAVWFVRGRSMVTRKTLPPGGQGWVARLPDGGGLQYCLHVTSSSLAPKGAQDVHIHSIAAVVTTDRQTSVSEDLGGRYPGWDNGATIYTQPFTGANVEEVEISYEFPLGMSCIEIYGRHIYPASYKLYAGHTVVGYSYKYRNVGSIYVTLFPVKPGKYLSQYSPPRRPEH